MHPLAPHSKLSLFQFKAIPFPVNLYKPVLLWFCCRGSRVLILFTSLELCCFLSFFVVCSYSCTHFPRVRILVPRTTCRKMRQMYGALRGAGRTLHPKIAPASVSSCIYGRPLLSRSTVPVYVVYGSSFITYDTRRQINGSSLSSSIPIPNVSQ